MIKLCNLLLSAYAEKCSTVSEYMIKHAIGYSMGMPVEWIENSRVDKPAAVLQPKPEATSAPESTAKLDTEETRIDTGNVTEQLNNQIKEQVKQRGISEDKEANVFLYYSGHGISFEN